MSETSEKLAKIVFSHTSSAAKKLMNQMVGGLMEMFEVPEKDREEKANRIISRMLEISNATSLRVGPDVLEKFYTEDQLQVLLKFYTENPWYLPISDEAGSYHMQMTQAENEMQMQKLMEEEFGKIE